MNRATVVYVAMLVVCAGGLWGIVRVGGRLRAPPSLAGTWDLDPPAAAGLGGSMTVEQSGRFVQVRFASGRTLDLKLVDGPPAENDPTVTLAGGGWRWSGPLTDGGRTMAVRLDGPETWTFTARRRADGQEQPAAKKSEIRSTKSETRSKPKEEMFETGNPAVAQVRPF